MGSHTCFCDQVILLRFQSVEEENTFAEVFPWATWLGNAMQGHIVRRTFVILLDQWVDVQLWLQEQGYKGKFVWGAVDGLEN